MLFYRLKMLTVAKISKTFGTDGGVLLNLYDAFPEDFDPANDPLFVEVDNLAVPLWCDRFEYRGASGALAVFADFDSAERIDEFAGRTLFVRTGDDDTAADDEFLPEDLIGFTVETDGRRGRIADFYDNEVNPLFGIEFDGREVLVPFAEEFIAAIDFEARHMKLILPEGLMEL